MVGASCWHLTTDLFCLPESGAEHTDGQEVVPIFLPQMLGVRTDIILTSDEDEDLKAKVKSPVRHHTPKTPAVAKPLEAGKRITPKKKPGKQTATKLLGDSAY